MKSLATLILIMIVGLGLCDIGWGQSLGTVFTYQGKLSYSGSPTAGEYDFEFKAKPPKREIERWMKYIYKDDKLDEVELPVDEEKFASAGTIDLYAEE